MGKGFSGVKQGNGGKVTVSKTMSTGALPVGVTGHAASPGMTHSHGQVRGHLGHAKPMPHGTSNVAKK